ncbi:MAG: ABC transporter substrate-binding protein [Rhodospirillales bacterium]|nr:ABC transporter substrate-binding protein [Rhodospirillales bacterium]
MRAVLVLFACIAMTAAASAASFVETPFFAAAVAEGKLPPVAERLPRTPFVVTLDGPERSPGRHGGDLRMLMSQPRDTRLMVVFGYARLVGYNQNWELVPDILSKLDVDEGRVFTLHLRKGHRWSDGAPFTAQDFKFFWEDVANNPDLSPSGPDAFLRVDGEAPKFEVIDETTVRYTWTKPNPFFLPALAGARPEFIFEPAHYLKAFHPRYADAADLQAKITAAGQRNWAALFTQKSRQYRNDNPELPSLQPWVLQTRPPSSYFIFIRNPFYHRVDQHGRQLPYIDRVTFTMASPGLIPAKTAAGDADLQARGIGFDNITVLKQGEKRNPYRVLLWKTARGAEVAIYPNLNTIDADLAPLVRNTDFRRALSLAIDRDEINQAVFTGFGRPGNDTVLPGSPLFKSEFETKWASFDLKQANAILDGLGLPRDSGGIRKLPSGRRLQMVVETAGEDPTEVAVLQLVQSTWRKLGIDLLVKPEQREILRNRVFSGEAVLSVWSGLENALPNANTIPDEMAPTSQQQLSWPKWGQHYESGGRAGAPIDLPAAERLAALRQQWLTTLDAQQRSRLWQDMLAIRADEVFTIGTVRMVPQPVVVSTALRNVPKEGIYNWEPGAFFGVYQPDTFWYADDRSK